MNLPITTWTELNDAQQHALLMRPAVSQDASVSKVVSEIVTRVRKDGDVALHELTREYDGATLTELLVDEDEVAEATRSLAPAQISAIDLAINNVRRFHEPQRHEPIVVETMPGVICERVSHPLDAVGLYVPAGTAPLPSAAIMLAVPANIAGCPTKILCTPPRRDGTIDPAVLVAATRAGVDHIYKVGGAQAIAAMAYGTESVPRVCKIFGPGNAWVTNAKALVSSDPEGAAIDMPAGPSEVLVIADDSAVAEHVASDLLSQAEHGDDSQVMLVATSEAMANAVNIAVEQLLRGLPRADIASRALQHSRIVLVPDIETAIAVSNRYAPEHLILQITDARSALPRIRNAGSVFVGPWTPESVGDYCSGTNHVLPTYGFARSYSGLGLDQFMRQMTIQELSPEGLAAIGDAVITLARLEGLEAHANAVTLRLQATS